MGVHFLDHRSDEAVHAEALQQRHDAMTEDRGASGAASSSSKPPKTLGMRALEKKGLVLLRLRLVDHHFLVVDPRPTGVVEGLLGEFQQRNQQVSRLAVG